MIKDIFISEEEHQNALKNVRADKRRKFAEWMFASCIVSNIIGNKKWRENILTVYEGGKNEN